VKPEAQEQNLLWELVLKSGYDLNTKISEQKAGKCRFYSVANGEMAVILGKADEKCLQEIVKLKPQKVVCLDNIFQANDQLKTNAALQMKDAGIEFRTV
ncbi:MAG: site-specific DNA-methyltransferase, partial [Elusimicrobia bacterium]|nr:site-specific DNA-methyltransferase [Elusimicrobiota bacterium]